MNSLFIRLWIALWLSIIVVAILSVGVFDYLRSQNMRSPGDRPAAVLQKLADDLAAANESGETPQSWLKRNINGEQPVYLLNINGDDLLGQDVPTYVLGSRRMNETDGRGKPGPQMRIRLTQELPALVGLTLAISRPKGGRPFRWLTAEVLIGLGFLVSGIVAVGLARYIALPIKQLKLASDQVAQGDFRTNVAAVVGGRKDELADLARRFDQMAEALGRSRELQQNLLRNISHELRSPLARLLITADLIVSAKGEERQLLQQRFKKDLGDLEAMIEEVLTLSRFDTESGSMQFNEQDVVEVLLPVFDDAQFEATALDKVVEFSYPDQSLKACVDSVQLKRAVENVVRNAIRHTPEGTTVHTQVKRDQGGIVVSVQDQGVGVTEDEIGNLFTPFYFYRSSEARTQFSGYGLGLALVKRILEAHGGCVSASNSGDSGLLVRLSLPLPP